MGAETNNDIELAAVDLYKRDESINFRLSEILRKRRRPLLLIIDAEGELLYYSLTGSSSPAGQRLLELAVVQTRNLFYSEFEISDVVHQIIVDKPGEKCALTMLEGELHSVRLFPLVTPLPEVTPNHFVVLIEPVAEPGADRLDYEIVRDKFRLSRREVDVLEGVVGGDTDKEIARTLGVSAETVRGYLKAVRAKLGVGNRAALVHLVHQLQTDGGRPAG